MAWIAARIEAAQVLARSARGSNTPEPLLRSTADAPEKAPEPGGGDHALGQRRRLDEKEPVVVGARERHRRCCSIHRQRRRDVEHVKRAHALAVIARQPVRDAAAAVVADEVEAFVAERAHHAAMSAPSRAWNSCCGRAGPRLGRVAVAAQVGADHRVVARQRGRDQVPHRVRFAGSRAASAAAGRRLPPPHGSSRRRGEHGGA